MSEKYGIDGFSRVRTVQIIVVFIMLLASLGLLYFLIEQGKQSAQMSTEPRIGRGATQSAARGGSRSVRTVTASPADAVMPQETAPDVAPAEVATATGNGPRATPDEQPMPKLQSELAVESTAPAAEVVASIPDDLATTQTVAALPEFDLIRIDPLGSGLVAGRAEPGSTVQILAGDAVIGTAEASSDGEFVAFVQTPDMDEGQVLSLLAQSGDGPDASAETVLVLPTEATADEAPQAPTIVSTSPEEVRVIQPSALGQVEGVTLDAISYDEAGEVRLSGRAPADQPIRIYVDGIAIGEAETSASGAWGTTLNTLAEGQYTLRVDALRLDGTVASRAESPFQRVFPSLEQLKNAKQITVQPGNSLWVLAEQRYGSGALYTQIFAANRDAIRDPDLIYPGQIFALPGEAEFGE